MVSLTVSSLLDILWASRTTKRKGAGRELAHLLGHSGGLWRRYHWVLDHSHVRSRETVDDDQGMAREDKRVPQGALLPHYMYTQFLLLTLVTLGSKE